MVIRNTPKGEFTDAKSSELRVSEVTIDRIDHLLCASVNALNLIQFNIAMHKVRNFLFTKKAKREFALNEV